MSFKKVRNYAVKVLALLSVACVAAGIVGAGLKPNKVIADDNLYPTLYDMFKATQATVNNANTLTA